MYASHMDNYLAALTAKTEQKHQHDDTHRKAASTQSYHSGTEELA